ncbi:hypothetical protein Tco_0220766, partial [Tanacetum coccineum]
VIFDEKKLGNS